MDDEFQNRWGWMDLCRVLAEYLHTDFFTILESRKVLEVLTMSTMMLEDMERKSININVYE